MRAGGREGALDGKNLAMDVGGFPRQKMRFAILDV